MTESLTAHSSLAEIQVNGEYPTLQRTCAELHTRVNAFLAEKPDDETLSRAQGQTIIALRVIEEALSKYSISELSLSYNGGKDCLVLLILFLSSLHTRLGPPNHISRPRDASSVPSRDYPSSIPAIYCSYSSSFQKLESFVTESSAHYNLSLTRYATSPTFGLQAAFSAYLDANASVKLIFVGTRRTDPHGANLTHFDETDRGWPKFVRCHPVIDWRYKEIWAFIRHLEIPYCSLYDEGYTSLGGTLDTCPNPVLLKKPISSTESSVEGLKPQFRPAYELTEDDEERLGRD